MKQDLKSLFDKGKITREIALNNSYNNIKMFQQICKVGNNGK